jgi:hypothetical protein
VAPGDASRASAALSLAWSRHDEVDCLRISGWPTAAVARLRAFDAAQLPALLPVYPTDAFGEPGVGPSRVGTTRLPAMAGRYVIERDSVCFLPRFPFRDAVSYTVGVDPRLVASNALESTDLADVTEFERLALERPHRERPATTSVRAVYPSVATIPRNHLRVYVHFTAPMSEGQAARRIRLRRAVAGTTLEDSFLALDPELWDSERTRLTVFLDPARIKRGLAPHQEAGYPLEEGSDIELVVDAGYRDACGAPLVAEYVRSYRVGPDVRALVAPEAWTLRTPAADSTEPLVVLFDRPLDRALLERCLQATDVAGHRVAGRAEVGDEEQSWRLWPDAPWPATAHELVVDPVLEDLAGNSVTRVFDRELARLEHQPREVARVVRSFTPTR